MEGNRDRRRSASRSVLLISLALIVSYWFLMSQFEGGGSVDTHDDRPIIAVLPSRGTNRPSTTVRVAATDVPPQTSLKPTRAGAEHSEDENAPGHPSRGVDGAVNGVILYLTGGLWEQYFVVHALPRLEGHFLQCVKGQYPVHIFHERMPKVNQGKIAQLLPSAKRVDFEDVSQIWSKLPKGVTEAKLQRWMNEGLQKKFQGRGYRQMCRFWAGLVWMLPSMDTYDVYWRLDTDSILSAPLKVDPFQYFVKHNCQYAFNRLKGENPHVIHDLWPTYQKWLQQTETLSTAEKAGVSDFMKDFALDAETKTKYTAPMYYNNFEMGTIALKRSIVLQDMFRFMDDNEPFGFLRYRWGDAPWHTLAVQTILRGNTSVCNITKDLVPYRHAARKPGVYVPSSECLLPASGPVKGPVYVGVL